VDFHEIWETSRLWTREKSIKFLKWSGRCRILVCCKCRHAAIAGFTVERRATVHVCGCTGTTDYNGQYNTLLTYFTYTHAPAARRYQHYADFSVVQQRYALFWMPSSCYCHVRITGRCRPIDNITLTTTFVVRFSRFVADGCIDRMKWRHSNLLSLCCRASCRSLRS